MGNNHVSSLSEAEQKREARLREIYESIAVLEAERLQLLGGGEELIADLRLSVRIKQALRAANLVTVADIRRVGSESDLLRLPNFGHRALRDLNEVLERRGGRLF